MNDNSFHFINKNTRLSMKASFWESELSVKQKLNYKYVIFLFLFLLLWTICKNFVVEGRLCKKQLNISVTC